MSSAKNGQESCLFGYELPPLSPGDYEIVTEQEVSALNEETQVLKSSQLVTVKTIEPYTLPPDLIHSYYPPSARLVTATTLPHVVLKGATAWERSGEHEHGTAPTPWLALLVFTERELSAPPEVLSPEVRPSGTKALTLSLDTINNFCPKFCQTQKFLKPKASAGANAPPATADFIFVNSTAFTMYFDHQNPSQNEPQTKADLERYKFLAFMTDTGVDDGTGHANARLSTLLGHRTRPYGLSETSEKVYAHLVSIEDLENRIDWTAAQSSTATIALISLFSWTFIWERNNEGADLEMFKHLGRPESTRSLAIPIPESVKESQVAMPWVKERITEGYTIVRHRDIAGETSMALYRGPLTPQATRKPHIRPSIHGTDLQIIDVTAEVLDVSYSTAWELGRSLAGRDAKFSAAMAGLRRQIYMHAVTKSKKGESDNKEQVMHQADDVIKSVLNRLNGLYDGPIASRIKGLPLIKEEKDKAARWQVPKHTATSTAAAPGSMTHAKLRRHLKDFAQTWIEEEARKLCGTAAGKPDIPELSIVFNWIINNLMSLKLVPATYLFPDPAVLVDESINCFLIDDVWIDAMVDGAMSLANTMGGGDDPIRDQIRDAFNIYLIEAPSSLVSIGGSGFILKSGVVESFPDLEITVTAKNEAHTPLVCPHQVKNENMIFCLVSRGGDKKLVNYDVQFKLPPHQQRFSMEDIKPEDMTFTFELSPYCKHDHSSHEVNDFEIFDEPESFERKVTWNRHGQVMEPFGSSFAPLWNWDTGVIIPGLVAEMTHYYIGGIDAKFSPKQFAKDSASLYLATQLTDRDHKIITSFNIIKEDEELMARQIFPEPHSSGTDTRDEALEHIPQSNSTTTDKAVETSWFIKQAFSQSFPGKSIPAGSNKTQQLVFSIKAMDKEKLPRDVEVLAIEVSIPLGEDRSDLLDPIAPLPNVKTLGPRQQWIAALTRKKSVRKEDQKVIQELVVHLKPRGGDSATLIEGLDASFVLQKATVNGVIGDDVKITVNETYRTQQMKAAGKKGTTVVDTWMLLKE